MILPKHYLKSAMTNFKRNKWYTSLMVLSLAAGMFCFILASTYINFEYSRNAIHENADRVYEVKIRLTDRGRVTRLTFDMAAELKAISPDIESITFLDYGRGVYLTANEEDYVEQKTIYYADSELFNVFSFPLKYGNEDQALDGVGKVVISNRLSELLFNGLNPVGEELKINEKGTFLVSGVLEDIDSKTLIYPELLFPRSQLAIDKPRWSKFDPLLTHIKVAQGVDIKTVEASMFRVFQSLSAKEELEAVVTEKLSDAYWGDSQYNYSTQYNSLTGSDKSMIKIIGYVSFGILLCAFVGYLSLSLGLSLRRAKEIGIRKANGASKSDIQFQLLSESVFYALLSLLISIIALELFSPYFSELFKIPMGLEYNEPVVLFGLVIFAVLTGLLAGAYPALVVSKLKPTIVLSGFNSKLGAGFRLKQALLVTQFVITVTLIFCVFVQHLQVQKMLGFDFGFKKEGILTFGVRNDNISKNLEAVLDDIRVLEGVDDISGGPFPYTSNGSSQFELDRGDTLLKSYISQVFVKDNFKEVMDVNFLKGGGFLQPEIPLSIACVINRPLAKALGEDALGMTITFDNKPRTIIGIVDQYVDLGINHFGSDPRVFLVPEKPNYHSLLVKHNSENSSEIVAQLETIWRKYEGVITPTVTNLQEETDYGTAILMEKTRLFTFLAFTLLSLSLLNLLGVSLSFAVGEVKGISIRRILGAETVQLFLRLTKPFLRALCIGLVVAIPLGYWLMRQYLNDYKVRIDLTLGHGLLVSIGMFVVLFLVIGYQMLRFSRIDPVGILKQQ
ncbi:MAG: putative ABC transport system permease protein [Roseivirga sp.]|jgi:putative ABC transport system permease protein